MATEQHDDDGRAREPAPSGGTDLDNPVPHGSSPSTLPLIAGQLLMVTTGFTDAYVYLQHGRIFAEAMTGNLVLAGVGLLQPKVIDFVPPLLAFVAFVVGVGAVALWERDARRRVPQLLTLGVEIVVLAVVASLPASFPDIAITTVIALASGLQIAVFGRLASAQVTATVMTSNAKRAVDAVVSAIRSHEAEDARLAWLYVSAVLGFAVGVGLGAGVCHAIGDRAAYVPAALLVVVAVRYAAAPRRGPANDGSSAGRT